MPIRRCPGPLLAIALAGWLGTATAVAGPLTPQRATSDQIGQVPIDARAAAVATRSATVRTATDRPGQSASTHVVLDLDRTISGRSVVASTIPSGVRDDGVTQWTDAFPVVEPGAEVVAGFDADGTLVSLEQVGPVAHAWSSFGSPFPISRLPVVMNVQADLPTWAREGIDQGIDWWERDPASFVELRPANELQSSPRFGDCSPADNSWVQFGDVRGSFDGAIGVATYCADSGGRTAFNVLLDATVSYSLSEVVAHEIGHGLGLGHADDPAAVMWPYATGHTALGADDLAGIRALYPGALAAFSTLPDGLSTYNVSRPRSKRAYVWVRPVGRPYCDAATVRLRLEPVSARDRFYAVGRTGYDPATGIATPTRGLTDEVCDFTLEVAPRSNADTGPGEVRFVPVVPDATQISAASVRVAFDPIVEPPIVTPPVVTPPVVTPPTDGPAAGGTGTGSGTGAETGGTDSQGGRIDSGDTGRCEALERAVSRAVSIRDRERRKGRRARNSGWPKVRAKAQARLRATERRVATRRAVLRNTCPA